MSRKHKRKNKKHNETFYTNNLQEGNFPLLSDKVTICFHGNTVEWADRNSAIKHFATMVYANTGTRKEEFTNIFCKLMRGDTYADDSSIN